MPRVPFVLVALLLAAPVLTGCLGNDEAPAAAGAGDVAGSAEEAGARDGPAPSAPKSAFVVEDESTSARLTAHPIAIPSNAARAPMEIDFSGEYRPSDCRPFNFGGIEDVLREHSHPRRFLPLDDTLQVGDVFSYEIVFSYVNSANNWAEIHPAFGFGNTLVDHEESTREMTEVTLTWSGQGYRASEDDMAWLWVNCWFGRMSAPIPYTYTLRLSFAEAAIPAQAPVLITIPEGATRLFVRGVPIDSSRGVLSHFRLFDPADQLYCECVLSSNEEATIIEVTEPGDYVLLVDHTDNGFVSLALDVPPTVEARALTSEWTVMSLFTADGGPVDQVVEFELPSVPLHMHAWVDPKDSHGAGKKTHVVVSNQRGEVMRSGWGGHITAEIGDDDQMWMGIWPQDWEFYVDHHAFAPGAHQAHVTAEHLRGEIFLVTRQYVR